MTLYLGLLLFSFILTSIAIIPFIDLLYRFHFTHSLDTSGLTDDNSIASQALHKLHDWKKGTPVGGGILIISVVVILYTVLFPLLSKAGFYISSAFNLSDELNLLFFTFISFAAVGLYDDLLKIFHIPLNRLSRRLKQLLILCLSCLCGLLLFQNLNISSVNLPGLGTIQLGYFYIPIAAGVIHYFATAVDFTDGLDGLSSGLLLICLLAFWIVSVTSLDTPLSVFIALWIGSLLAFLYFNVYPARIWLGNAGAISFGATLAVVALLLGKGVALIVIGGIYVIELASSLLQFVFTKFFHRRIFPITPIHHWLQVIGWPEPKIVQRSWLIALILAIFGLWLAAV